MKNTWTADARTHHGPVISGRALKKWKRNRPKMSPATKDMMIELVGGLVLVILGYILMVVWLCL